MAPKGRPLAVVTGASSGIGYELAKLCAQQGFDLVAVADEPEIEKAAADFRALGAHVDGLQADLASWMAWIDYMRPFAEGLLPR
jgi:NAD(P)-dependent dehydrogenase (short-subunit alcohol dehydrogenase family)